MKKIDFYRILIILLSISELMIFRIYAQDDSAIVPFKQIAKSTVIEDAILLKRDNVVSIMKNRSNTTNKINPLKVNELSGEYFDSDGYMVNIKSIPNKKSLSLTTLQKIKKSLDTGYEQMGLSYHNMIKTKNNFTVLVSYLENTNKRTCFIIDNKGKSYVVITVYDIPADGGKKADAFIDTLLNSITFK